MGKRLIITESERSQILNLYGVLQEQKYISDYSKLDGNLLDFCGYRAIEVFEETKGNEFGKSMGNNYFETSFRNYENLISKRIDETIGLNIFSKFPPKLKMQIWSWMFNSTDASNGTNKWLAGLSQAMNPQVSNPQSYRLSVMQDPTKAITEIQNFKGDWNQVYSSYLNVLDQQYKSTASNNKKQGSYDNSWKFRPTDLDKLYDECPQTKPLENKAKTAVEPSTDQSLTRNIFTSGQNFKELNEKFKGWDLRLDGEKYKIKEVRLTEKNNELTVSAVLIPDQNGSSKLRFLGNPITELKGNRSVDRALEKNPGSKILKSGTAELTNTSGQKESYEFHILGLD